MLGATNDMDGVFYCCMTAVALANNDSEATNSFNIDKSRTFKHKCLYFN